MISKGPIQRELGCLSRLYSSAQGRDAIETRVYCSKLGVLELSGWIEAAFDEIAIQVFDGKFLDHRSLKIAKEAVKTTYGFHYEDNFMKMMSRIVGAKNMDVLNRQLDVDGSLSVLEGQISALNDQRKKAAHVHLDVFRGPYDEPKISLSRLKVVYPIIARIDAWIVANCC